MGWGLARRVHHRTSVMTPFAASALALALALSACALPALVICASWLRIEDPRRVGEAMVVVALALVPLYGSPLVAVGVVVAWRLWMTVELLSWGLIASAVAKVARMAPPGSPATRTPKE